MTKSGKLACLILSVCFALVIGLMPHVGNRLDAYAYTDSSDNTEAEEDTRGIYTYLSLSINGGDGKVWATVKNDITIFPSTVYVTVELYASDVYCSSYTDMELVTVNSVNDLNIGQTVTAQAETGGKKRYWLGRMRYKVDSGAWKSGDTGIVLYDADGTYLGNS